MLGCMALGYMVLPLLPNRQLQLEGDGLRLLAQRHEDPLAVQSESRMDTVEVDLALAQDADRAEINAEADFMFREVDVNGDGETAAYLSLTQILIQTRTLTLTPEPPDPDQARYRNRSCRSTSVARATPSSRPLAFSRRSMSTQTSPSRRRSCGSGLHATSSRRCAWPSASRVS